MVRLNPQTSLIGTRQFDRRLIRAIVVLMALIVPLGCTTPRRTYQPPQDPSTLDDAAFLHYLATVPTVTVAEGVRAVGLLAGQTHPAEPVSFEDQSSRLESLGALRSGWRLQPQDTLDKGTLAFMITVVCRTPQSLAEAASAVTGIGDRRYALKTCIEEGLLPYGLSHDPVTGGELISSLSKAERFCADGSAIGS